jgi:hypothetical protein
MGAITRSEGYELTVGAAPVAVAGGGYSGCTAELDAVVAEAAQALAAAYGQDVDVLAVGRGERLAQDPRRPQQPGGHRGQPGDCPVPRAG